MNDSKYERVNLKESRGFIAINHIDVDMQTKNINVRFDSDPPVESECEWFENCTIEFVEKPEGYSEDMFEIITNDEIYYVPAVNAKDKTIPIRYVTEESEYTHLSYVDVVGLRFLSAKMLKADIVLSPTHTRG